VTQWIPIFAVANFSSVATSMAVFTYNLLVPVGRISARTMLFTVTTAKRGTDDGIDED
jgi:hypothetical protein